MPFFCSFWWYVLRWSTLSHPYPTTISTTADDGFLFFYLIIYLPWHYYTTTTSTLSVDSLTAGDPLNGNTTMSCYANPNPFAAFAKQNYYKVGISTMHVILPPHSLLQGVSLNYDCCNPYTFCELLPIFLFTHIFYIQFFLSDAFGQYTILSRYY